MIDLAVLVVREAKATILAKFLQVAQTVGLNVTSWEVGDPTDTQFQAYTEVFDALEETVSRWIKATFLDTAAADSALYDWLVWTAYQGFGYVAREATYAGTTITLSNALGANYGGIEPNDLSFRNSSTGATYHNTEGGDLASGPGATLTLAIEADLPGSTSSAGVGDIDEMVTTLNGVTCTNVAAAIGLDAEPAASIVNGARAKLAMMSPNGARDAYRYVATTPALSGTSAVTMARSTGDSATGDVTILLAGPNMPIAVPDVALVQSAIERLCTPLCITPSASSASAHVVNVAYTAYGYASWGVTTSDAAALIEAAVRAWFVERPISGDVIPPAMSGAIDVNMIEAVIQSVAPSKITRVLVTTPAASVAIGAVEKPTCGTVTATAPFAFIPDP